MKPRLKSTRAARDLIKTHEPFHGEAVRRGKRFVVGYGHTAAAKPGQTLSRENAELLLIYDVLQAETAVHAALGEDIPGPVRDALVSFAASVGLNAFKVSDVARLARSGRYKAAAAALETWVRAEEDGRLVTSDRLVARRAAEKALLLSAFAETPAEPEPEAPAPFLIDVDIAFEDPEAEDAAPVSPASEEAATPAEPETEAEATPEPAAQADPEAPAEADAEHLAEEAAPESLAPEAETSQADTAASVEPAPSEPEVSESEPSQPAAAASEPDAAHEDPVKASQDAAIQAVMSRMAGEIARSVSVGGVRRPDDAPEETAPAEPEVRRDLTDVQLGYSFLEPDVVGWGWIDEDEEAAPVDAEAEPAAQVEAEPETPQEPEAASEPEDTPGEASGEAAGPGRAVASPAPGPVYATVAVGPVAKPESAPPHPAEAPADAPGHSGESEGPDHPEEADAGEAGEDEAELEPAIVAGPEAAYVAEMTPPHAVERRGQWVHGLNLAVGAAFLGMGGWMVVSNFDLLLADGVMAHWPGPILFALGVLLLVSSGWVVLGDLLGKSKD